MQLTTRNLTLGGKIALAHLLVIGLVVAVLFVLVQQQAPVADAEEWSWGLFECLVVLLDVLFLPVGIFFDPASISSGTGGVLTFVGLVCVNSFLVGYGIQHGWNLWRGRNRGATW